MSLKFDQLKASIDSLDFKLSGSPWTIGGSLSIPAIKEESVTEFNNVWLPVVELSVMTKDFPIDVSEGAVVISEDTDEVFTISRILPEIDGQVTLWIKPNA
jgi:hypothetical protein